MTEQTWINPEIDRSDWGPGPWDGEPDKVYWTDEATGFPCIASRGNPRFGNWCGYVAVEPGHPLHGKDYEAPDVDVHGGLTYAASCSEDEPETVAVCHVPEPGRPADVWWFGFDAGHAWDVSPGLFARDRARGGFPLHEGEYPFGPDGPRVSYKTLEFIKAECASLAKQLKDLDA